MVNKLRKKLTERQKKILKAVENFILAHGYSPTIRQLGKLVNIVHPSAVFKHILSLEKKGYLKRMKGEVRLTGFPSPAEAQVKIPLVGLVPAGDPKEVFDVSGEAVDVPDWMVGGHIFLVPENPEFDSIEVKELRVLGRVIGR